MVNLWNLYFKLSNVLISPNGIRNIVYTRALLLRCSFHRLFRKFLSFCTLSFFWSYKGQLRIIIGLHTLFAFRFLGFSRGHFFFEVNFKSGICISSTNFLSDHFVQRQLGLLLYRYVSIIILNWVFGLQLLLFGCSLSTLFPLFLLNGVSGRLSNLINNFLDIYGVSSIYKNLSIQFWDGSALVKSMGLTWFEM